MPYQAVRSDHLDIERVTTARIAIAPQAAAGIALVAVGFGVGLLVAWEPEPPQPDAASFESEAVAIGAGSYDASFTAPVSIRWSEPVGITAHPSVTGMVTASNCGDGGVVRSGDRLLDVDGIGRIAFHSSPPMYRTLQEGDGGPDVVELRRLVGAQGTSGTFDPALGVAVGRYNRSLGAGDGEIFDPTTVFYLPTNEILVGQCLAPVGSVLSGAPILVSAVAPQALSVAAPDGLPDLPGPWVADVDGRPVPLHRIGDSDFVSPDGADLAALQLRPPSEDTDGIPSDLQTVVRLATPMPSATVPASALYTQGRSTCMVVGHPDDFEVREVVVLDARLGVVQIGPAPGEDPLAGTVVTNASLIAADRPCPDR